jgi:hypothetical protein
MLLKDCSVKSSWMLASYTAPTCMGRHRSRRTVVLMAAFPCLKPPPFATDRNGSIPV